MEVPSGDCQVQCTCSKQGQLEKIAQDVVQSGLNISKDGDSITSLFPGFNYT